MHTPTVAAAGFTRRQTLSALALAAAGAALAAPRAGAQDAPKLTVAPLAGPVSLLTGAGGNIALLAGPEGVLAVDSGLANVATGTAGEIAKLGPLALLVNTHWHFDHAGGNERLAAAGARIVASENCRARLSTDQSREELKKVLPNLPARFPAAPPAARPVVTFTHETALHLGGERTRLVPVAPAHTDGDVLVRFENANVLHCGDTFFHGFYPFIDWSSGGWIGGMVACAKVALSLTDAGTKIIPGHGPVASQEQFKSYLAFLELAHDRLAKLKSEGKTADEAVAADPFKDHHEKLGGGFLKPEQFTRIAYEGLLRHKG